MIKYDEFGTLVLSDELAQQVAGGDIMVTARVKGLILTNVECYGVRLGQIPVSYYAGVNGTCYGGNIQTGETPPNNYSYVNAMCANNSGGMNPVCVTNVGCG